MIIIGEKINGAIPKTAEAILRHDEAYLVELVKTQEACGADYLDVCAGTPPEIEYETLCWMVDVIQEVAEKPLCIDSPDPIVLERIFPRLKKPGIINSISAEGNKCEVLLPILRDHPEWQVIALCSGNNGVAVTSGEKSAIAFALVEKAAAYGVTPDRIHLDPLVLALPAVNDSAVQFCGAIEEIKTKYPDVKVTAALSNISYGMPVRSLVNRNFLTLAIAGGLDTVIADPANRDVIGNIYATEALLGKDRHCRKYGNAYRKGLIGPGKDK